MLEFVATGIAMGNGTDVAKNAAEFVTTDIHKDGIWNGLKALWADLNKRQGEKQWQISWIIWTGVVIYRLRQMNLMNVII